MAKERYINTKFWDDSYIVKLDPIEKLLFIYLLTNPLTNICGIYEVSLRRVAFDTGIEEEVILTLLRRFEEKKKIKYKNGYVIIKNFIKHQKNNPKINIGIASLLTDIPEDILEWIDIDLNRLPLEYDKLSHLNLNLNLNSNLNSNSNFNKDSIEYKCSKYLFKKIKKHTPKFREQNLQSWAKHIDLMLRIDKRDIRKIKEIIDWCQTDDFWQSNILSTKKLREQYDQLSIKSKIGKNEPKQNGIEDWGNE